MIKPEKPWGHGVPHVQLISYLRGYLVWSLRTLGVISCCLCSVTCGTATYTSETTSHPTWQCEIPHRPKMSLHFGDFPPSHVWWWNLLSSFTGTLTFHSWWLVVGRDLLSPLGEITNRTGAVHVDSHPQLALKFGAKLTTPVIGMLIRHWRPENTQWQISHLHRNWFQRPLLKAPNPTSPFPNLRQASLSLGI